MKMNRGNSIYLVAAVLLPFVYSANAGVTDTTCTPNDATNGNPKCVKVDVNAECPADGTHCACKADFVLKPKDNTKCVQKITLVECTPNDQTNGDTKCQNVDANAECSTSATKCACKAGYKGTDICAKVSVLETSCSGGNNDCAAEHSECDGKVNTPKCKCSDGYKQETTDNTKCTAVLGTTCKEPTECTDVQSATCTGGVCSCETNYIKDGFVCVKKLGQTCSTGECATHAECETTCKCSDGYIDTDGLCAVPSSTITTRLSTSVFMMSIICTAVRNVL